MPLAEASAEADFPYVPHAHPFLPPGPLLLVPYPPHSFPWMPCTRYLELTNSFQITSCCRPPRAPHGPEIDSIARSMTPSTTFNATAHDLEEILVASRPSEVGPK